MERIINWEQWRMIFATSLSPVLASASKAQNIIDKAPSLLAELNPMYKEKQETEQRFGKIEKSISGMEELMKKQQEMMENFIKKFES